MSEEVKNVLDRDFMQEMMPGTEGGEGKGITYKEAMDKIDVLESLFVNGGRLLPDDEKWAESWDLAPSVMIKEVLTTTDASILIPAALDRTMRTLVLEVAKLRKFLTYMKAASSTLIIPRARSIKADRVPEGGQLPMDTVPIEGLKADVFKTGIRTKITNEMIEDSKWAVISLSIKLATMAMGHREDLEIIKEFIAGAGLGYVATGNQFDVNQVSDAIKQIKNEAFMSPDTIFVSNAVEDAIRRTDQFKSAAFIGGATGLKMTDGGLGSLWGLQIVPAYFVPDDTVIIFNKGSAGIFAEKRPLTSGRMDDPINDMVAFGITQRFVPKIINPEAVAVIQGITDFTKVKVVDGPVNS